MYVIEKYIQVRIKRESRASEIKEFQATSLCPSLVPLARAAGSTGLVGAVSALATGDIDIRPGPVRAAAGAAAVNPDRVGGAANGARDAIQLKVGDGDTSGGFVAVVGLGYVDTVLGDAGEGDVGVVDTTDGTSVARLGLWGNNTVSKSFFLNQRDDGLFLP